MLRTPDESRRRLYPETRALRRRLSSGVLRLGRAHLALAGYRLAARVAPLVPRSVAYRLSDRVGDLSWRLNRTARRAVHANLGRVLGRRASSDQVRAVFRHGARNYYDTFLIPTLGRRAILDLVRVAGWEHLDAALAAGRGAIMVGVHLSSVALAGQVIAARGYTLTSVVERVEPPELHELLVRLRAGGGVRIAPLGADLMQRLLAALRSNELVGLVMDRDVAGTGVTVEFFGAPTELPGGAALLGLRTGAAILPAVAVRSGDNRFEGWIGPPVEAERGADVRESVARTTRRIAERLERHIGAHPEQWTVFQPVWPAGRVGSSGDPAA